MVEENPLNVSKTLKDALNDEVLPSLEAESFQPDSSASMPEPKEHGESGSMSSTVGDCINARGLVHSKSNLSMGASVIKPPSITLGEFEVLTVHLLNEFLRNDDFAQISEKLKALDASLFHDVFVFKCVQSVLPQGDEVQGKVAQLITILYDAKVVTRPQITRGFEKLIQSAERYHETISQAEDKLFAFFAAASDDNVVDANFLQKLPEALIRNLSTAVTSNEPYLRSNMTKLQEYKHRCEKYMAEFFNDGTATAIETFLRDAEFIFQSPNGGPDDSQIENSTAAARPVESDMFRHEFVRKVLSTALEKKPLQKEMVSKALSNACGLEDYKLNSGDIQLGVLRLLANVEDLALDNPRASEEMSKFIVRMVIDDILPPAFISDFIRLSLGDALGLETLRRAREWMALGEGSRHNLLVQRFSKIWTAAEGHLPEVELFKRTLREIILNYFDSCDLQQAIQALNQLELSPDQEIEVVRKIIVFAMDRQQKEWTLALTLLESLKLKEEIYPESIVKGFLDIQDKLPDIQIDNPNAQKALRDFFGPEAKARLLLPKEFVL